MRRACRRLGLGDARIAYAALAVVVAAAGWWWLRETSGFAPYVDYDTQIFQQVADRPFGLDALFDAKPLFVPLIYRLAGNDLGAVVTFQTAFAFVAWTILTATLAGSLRRRWARAAAIAIGIALLVAPARVGFTASLLSESIDDSLMALVAAGAIAVVRLRGRRRVIAASATGVIAAAWLVTRDTNAFVAIAAAGAAIIVWRGWRRRRAWLVAAAVVVAGATTLWTTTRPHELLPYQGNWYPALSPRNVYPMLDNLVTRAYPDDPGAFPPELRDFVHPDAVWRLMYDDARYRPLQDWLVDHGAAVYARWLVSHPLDRIGDLVAGTWTAITVEPRHYMPGGWHRGFVLRRLTTSPWTLGALLLLTPLLLRRPRADPLCGLAVCMLASSAVGLAASYYGDAAEMARHCYPAGQQLVLGLFVALLAWLDRLRLSGAGSAGASRDHRAPAT